MTTPPRSPQSSHPQISACLQRRDPQRAVPSPKNIPSIFQQEVQGCSPVWPRLLCAGTGPNPSTNPHSPRRAQPAATGSACPGTSPGAGIAVAKGASKGADRTEATRAPPKPQTLNPKAPHSSRLSSALEGKAATAPSHQMWGGKIWSCLTTTSVKINAGEILSGSSGREFDF